MQCQIEERRRYRGTGLNNRPVFWSWQYGNRFITTKITIFVQEIKDTSVGDTRDIKRPGPRQETILHSEILSLHISYCDSLK